jgi:putative nucleotidyltransferase with HDIG domain
METAQVNQWLKEEVAIRAAEVRRERATLERVTIATLEVLVNALEAKDPFSRGHSARVADLSAMIASELQLSDEDIEVIRTAGRLHDIGKIGIREEVLAKQGPLTPAEYEHVKDHVIIGTQILAPLAHLHGAIVCMRSHHERWDGEGYPDRLRGEDIPLGARILGIAEIFDALTTSRPRGPPWTPPYLPGWRRSSPAGRPSSSSKTPTPPEAPARRSLARFVHLCPELCPRAPPAAVRWGRATQPVDYQRLGAPAHPWRS